MNFWQDVEKTSGMGTAYPWHLAGFLFTILLLMFFFRQARTRLRTALILFGLSLAGILIAAGLLPWGFGETGSLYRAVRFAALLLQAIAMVNVAGVFLFDGLLAAVRLNPPRIAQDLVVALAYLAIAIALLAQSGVDLRGIVATSAVLTAVIGFSLQDTLGNIMGGMALQMEHSIRVGDWIRVDDLEGKVKEIRWRQTSVETRNWDTVVIPNSALIRGKVTLLGRRTGQPIQRRQWVYFHVDLTHSPTKVLQTVEAALCAEPIPCVAAEPAMHCLITDVKNGEAMYAVRYWLTDLAVPDPTDSLIRTRVYAALRRANIPLSIPAQSVILTEETSQRERLEGEEAQARLAAVQSLQFFKPLTDDERRALAAALVNAPFVKGEAITRQGAQANWLYMIVDGEADVRTAVDGLAKKVATLHAGDYFGEMGLMTGEPRAATVIAQTDVKCYRLGKEAFAAILLRRPELADQISQTLAERRIELDSIKHDLSAEALREQMLKTQKALRNRIRDFFGLPAGRAP
jgi:small-conductance mechanosensitive channel/CRP-like cAMP-binding protein